jgi:hypothetical protein
MVGCYRGNVMCLGLGQGKWWVVECLPHAAAF